MSSKHDIRHRAAQKKLLNCTVQGCDKPRHGVSPHCHVHAQRQARHGSATGAALTHRELAPFVTEARKFLVTNAEHDAIKETIANLDHWFATAARCVSTAKTKSYDHRLIRELYRLKQDEDVTGAEVLTHVLAVFLLTQANEHRLQPLSREHRFAVARVVLNLTTRFTKFYTANDGTSRRTPVRLSTVLLDRFGCSLLEETISLCSRIAATLKQTERDDRDRRDRLKAALQEPFV